MDKEERYRQVAALHAANIDQGFLATLGVPFLTLMYQAIDEADDSVLLVEERDGRVLGFIAGGEGMGAIYRRMLRSPLRLGWSLSPIVLRPRAIARILEILRYGRGHADDLALPDAELLSIAVAPESRGSGIAEALYRRLIADFERRGVKSFKITVGDALLPAHRFYIRMGAMPAGKMEVHAGKVSTIYTQNIFPG